MALNPMTNVGVYKLSGLKNVSASDCDQGQATVNVSIKTTTFPFLLIVNYCNLGTLSSSLPSPKTQFRVGISILL